MMHEGKTDAAVSLGTMLPDPDLFALGALAGLAGEVTVLGGMAYLAYPQGADEARTEMTEASAAGAALLVAARVPAWQRVTMPEAARFEDLDEAIAGLAGSVGWSADARFPFLMEGEFEALRFHVIDGARLPAGAGGHGDHTAASVKMERTRATARVLGFYSRTDEGVFTHMGSRTHLHCVLEEPLVSGHVDHIVVPAGTEVRFPAGRR
jgi:acetolactate decarboxylase